MTMQNYSLYKIGKISQTLDTWYLYKENYFTIYIKKDNKNINIFIEWHIYQFVSIFSAIF